MNQKVFTRLLAFAMLALLTTSTSQAQENVDFTDGIFETLSNSGINDEPVIFTETTSTGGLLTFESTINLVGTRRFLGVRPDITGNGLHLGGGGGSTVEFTVMSDQEIQLLGYSTDTAPGLFLGDATFDIIRNSDSEVLSTGNLLAQGVANNALNGGPITFDANELYTFDIENTNAAVQSFVSSFSIQAVPEPGSISLAFGALLLFGTRRRR